MKIKGLPIYYFALFVGLLACKGREIKDEARQNSLTAQFFKNFSPLNLPYIISTGSGSQATFQALMTENHVLDSSLVIEYELDNIKQEPIDSTQSMEHFVSDKSAYKYYSIGRVCENEQFVALLYGRDNPSHEDVCVVLVTYNKQGKKIDQIIFHRPLWELPPVEIQKVSHIKTDTTISLTSIVEEHRFVNEKNNYMELIEKNQLDKIYRFESTGKISLKNEAKTPLSTDKQKAESPKKK